MPTSVTQPSQREIEVEGETLSVDRSRWVMPDREPVTTITGEPT